MPRNAAAQNATAVEIRRPVPPEVVVREAGQTGRARAVRRSPNRCGIDGPGWTNRFDSEVRVDLAISSSRSRRRGPGVGAQRRLGDVRRQFHLRVVPVLGLCAAQEVDRQRDAARHQPAAPERHVCVCPTDLPDGRNGFSFYGYPPEAFADQAITQPEGNPNADRSWLRQVRTGLVRRRMDRRARDSVQVVARSILHRRDPGIRSRAAASAARTSSPDSTTVPASTGGSQGIFRVSVGNAGRSGACRRPARTSS